MRLALLGDIVVETSDRPIRVGSELRGLLVNADYRVANVECPVTTHSSPIAKTGRCFRCGEEVIRLLVNLGVDLATLANNHIRDQGASGVRATIARLEDAGIAHVGAGEDCADAARPVVVQSNGQSVAILNFAEHEWATVGPGQPGSNPYDVVECARSLMKERERHDHVVLVVHAGVEHYPLPTPRMVNEFRFLVECGASAVVAHHTHIATAWEVYKGAPILYGLGNFVAESRRSDEHLKTGLLALLSLGVNRTAEVDVRLTHYDSDSRSVDLHPHSEGSRAGLQLQGLQEVLADPLQFRASWRALVASRSAEYLQAFHPLNRPRSRLAFRVLRRLGLVRRPRSRNDLADVLNRVRCESHRDVLVEALDQLPGE